MMNFAFNTFTRILHANCQQMIQETPKIKKKDYQQVAEEALQKAVSIIESDGWKKERSNGNGDIIYSKTIPIYGKVFKFEGILNMPAAKVIDILYYKVEEMHKWNPTVKKCRIIEKINEHVDISHTIATEGAAGLVASRDFVNIRIWKKKNSDYLHGSVATNHLEVPEIAKYVRGEQGPTVYIMSPISENPQQCKLTWLLNTNLKGWIPQYLIDQTLSTVMLDYVHSLRKHSASSKTSV
ncbi:hypothetical protein JTE90_028767 [Oedothorax gibbosus]|uniref:START domain-containing protein n=1 Tax=Oedothorax gibbosus TaxID=931172 RepID=A0AAV6VWZ1_9ARAC|nr:hypothetical protein JTE90_028767 [Oedothorax gibbosus]